MIVWRGWGILVVIVAALAVALVRGVTVALFGAGTYDRQGAWLLPLSLTLAAPIVWPLGRFLNGRDARTLVDPATGQRVTLRPDHSLFFIRMEYWAIILVLVAVASLIYRTLGG